MLADHLKNKFYKEIGEGELLHDGRKFQLKWCNNNPYWRKVQLNGKLISIMESGLILNKDCNSRIGNGGFHRKNFHLYAPFTANLHRLDMILFYSIYYPTYYSSLLWAKKSNFSEQTLVEKNSFEYKPFW
jgi:hypothetical protein